MKYKLLLDDIKIIGDQTLYRIQALEDFGNIKAGDLGGYIAYDRNLSHEGNAWVFGDAQVFGNARVYDNAQVFGDARVYGDACVYGNACVANKKECLSVISHKYHITITKNHIAIGCEMYEIKHWSKHIKEIGKKYGYTDNEIKGTILILKGLLLSRKD